MKRNIPKVIDYVDKLVIVDGFSVDGTKEWLENYNPRIKVVQRKWDDSFANQYNEYLNHIDEGWVIICDDDEIPSEEMLKCLPQVMIDSNEGKRYSAVEFRCNPIEVDRDGKILEDHGPENYYRQLFFKYNPGIHYIIDLHQALVGLKNHNRVRRQEVYYHIKSDEDMYRNACRNFFIAGIWMPNASDGIRSSEWYDLKRVIGEAYPNVKVFNDFNTIMIKGNMDKRVKDYLYEIKDIPDEPEKNRMMNELRAYFTYYFEKLHGSERIEYEKNVL